MMEYNNVASTFPLEVSVRCDNLCLFDGETNLNPLCVLYKMYEKPSNNPHDKDGKVIGWSELGRTEKLSSNKDPDWKNMIEFNYTFGDHVIVKFEVYHVLENSDWGLLGNTELDSGPSSHESIGTFETPLGALLANENGKYSTTLRLKGMSDDWIKTLGDSSLPKIHFEIKEKDAIRKVVSFEFRAENLDDKDFMGKSDPYLTIFSQSTNGQLSHVYKSEVIKDNLNPKWKPFKVEMLKLCNGDYNKRIKIDVHDYDSIGSHDFIGSFVTTMNQLQNNIPNELKFPITNEEKKGDKDKRSGSVIVVRRDIEVIPTFIKLLQTKTKMNLSIAFDFTESNGDPSDKSSLHYISPYTDNPYMFASRSVIEGISSFSTDQPIYCYGYGAKIPQQETPSDIFSINLNNCPDCLGVDGALNAYKNCVKEVTFSPSCNLAPIINHVAKQCQTLMVDGKQYFVLLILTNGDVNDLDATKSALSAVSDWPLSIVIVGIGNRDFSPFDELRGDYRPPTKVDKRKSKPCTVIPSRSNFHFLDLKTRLPRDSLQNHSLIKRSSLQKTIAMEILSQVPAQFADWMSKSGKNLSME